MSFTKRLKVFLLTLSSIIGSEISIKGSFTVEILKRKHRIYTFLENVELAKSVESERQRPGAGTNYSIRVKPYSCVVCDPPRCECFSTFCAM